MDSVVDILSSQTETHPVTAPVCVHQGRKSPLFRGVHNGSRPHEVYSPGPISVCSVNSLIFIADDKSDRVKVYTWDANFITYFRLKWSEQIHSLFAEKDALFVLNKNKITVFEGMSCFTNTFSDRLIALDISKQLVYIATRTNCILILEPNLAISGAIELSKSYLTEKSCISDFQVSDNSIIYAIFSRSTFPFQLFTVHGVFIRHISYPCSIISPQSISISKYGYTAISDETSKCVKVFSPDFNIVHTLDGIFEIGRVVFLDNYILVTNSAIGLFNLHFF